MPDVNPPPTRRFPLSLPLPRRRRAPDEVLPAGPEGTVEDIASQEIAEAEAADRQMPPPEPIPLEDPPARLNTAVFRLAALGLALVLALALAVVKILALGPPSLAQLRAEAGVDAWPVLPIGVKSDQPGVAFYDSKNKIWSGFDIDIAYMVAEDLGFRRDEVRFYAIESEDRARMQASDQNGKRVPVKLVIASYSITADRKAMPGVLFSDPYLYTEESVLTLRNHARVSTFDDLKGQNVCSLSASTSTSAPVEAHDIVHEKNMISECIDELRAGTIDAVATDAAILAGYKARYPGEFSHWDVGYDASERWGINVGENKALQTLVDITLYKSLHDPSDNRWELAYQNNLQSEVGNNSSPVNAMNTPIAVGQQPPDLARPYVRNLPWENTLQ